MANIARNVEITVTVELRDAAGDLDTATTGAPTISLCKDGVWAATANSPTNTKAGYWKITLADTETDVDELVVEASKTGFVTYSVAYYPTV